MERADTTNKLFIEWLRSNALTLLLLATGIIVAYVKLDAQVQALDRRGQERSEQRERQISEINAQIEAIKVGYVTRTELNTAVISRLDRIETKLDAAISK